MTGNIWRKEGEAAPEAAKRPGRGFLIFRSLILLVLLGVTAYGMVDSGLYGHDRWLPVAAGILCVVFLTLFVRRFYEDFPRFGWVLVALLAVLTGIKGLSMLWTISDTLTIQELLRSSMYLATFALSLAALTSARQLAPVMDASILIVAAVAVYGALQKIYPEQYPVSSLDGVRVDSFLDYPNTTAIILAMGALLVLSRMTQMRNAAVRGVYAALLLLLLTVLYLTVSRGGIASLGIGGIVLFALTGNRLQMLANSLLVALPGGWLLWRMFDTEGLLQAGASEQQTVEAGLSFRADLLISLVAAFVLQAGYALLVNRHELSRRTRRWIGIAAAAGAVVVLIAGLVGVASRYGGVGEAYGTLLNNPSDTQDTAERLTSISIGFRADYWEAAWQAWKERPLTGTGAGTFQYTWLEERDGFTGVKQVHNVYLEQGTETGVFAFLALVGFSGLLVGYVGLAAWRSESGDRRLLLAGLAAALTAYLVSSGFEWHWYIPPSTLLFFILGGAAVRAASMQERKPFEERAPAPEPETSGREDEYGEEGPEEDEPRQP